MNQEPKYEIKTHLDKDEELIWSGRPKQGIVFRSNDIFLIPFSIVWCGLAIFWLITAANESTFFALLGIPFVLIGLILVFGRFILEAKQRESTFYGITQDRIIIKSGIFSSNINSLNIRTLSEIEYNEKNDESGSITFGPKNPMIVMSIHGMDWWPGMKSIPSLQLIPDVRTVYKQIIELQRKN